MCPSAAAKLFFCPLTSPPEWSDQKIFWTAKSKTIMSWAQQREQIRRAAQAGVRPRTSGLGSQILPLRGPGGQSAQLTRPNGALTRAGQFFYQLAGRQPPSRQFDDSQPLIREGASDFILLRSGLKKLVRTLAPDGNYTYEAGQGLLQGEVHRVAGPCAGADPRAPQERPGLRAAGLPARDLAERGAAEAERRAVGGAGGPQRQASGAAEAGQPVGGRRDHGDFRGGHFIEGAREWTLSSQTWKRCSPTSTPSATAAGRSGASRPRRSASSAFGGARRCSS